MNEESDGINENENNSSEVIILPDRSHGELLLSEQSQLREEQNAYERKLDEKLKDLGLYEDDMTINQKEELLAVVVISCETAEQEENKRQLIREYLEGAQSLEEEIEFSYQESAWLAGEANLLCSSTVTQLKDDDASSNTKILSFMDGEASTSGTRSFDSIAVNEKSRNSPDIFEDETEYTEISEDQQPSTSENSRKKSLLHKSRTRSEKRGGNVSDSNVKIAVAHPIVQEQDVERIETTEVLDRQLSFQRQKLLLDKSMGCWKPCGSPKDEPLSNFRIKQKKDEHVSAAAFQEKVNKYLACFEKVASSLKSRRSFVPKVTQLSKPYVLMHHGSVAKKATKLDNYDCVVGVSEKNQNSEENEDNFIPCNTLTRAKSAFHRVKPLAHGKLVSFSDQNSPSESSAKVTRSGATYGSKRFKSETEKSESSPEIIDESYNITPSTSKDHNNVTPEKRVTFHDDVIEDNNKKLPKFSDLRPDITKCKMIIPSPISQKNSSQSDDKFVKSNCDLNVNSSAKRPKKEETVGNRSDKECSSDSSSPLIDVETVVDDEIEEFVLKRKLSPSAYKSIKNQPPCKRLKRSES